MKGVNNITKWESVIEWFEESKYSKLTDKTKNQLKEFRRINHYISVLKSSIESREREIERLKNKILIKKEGIRKHKNRGNELYDRLVSLKKQKEIVVYYTEGTSKKKLTGDKWSNNGGVKTYKQTNIKYKFRNSSSLKTINLKPTRKETLNEIKIVCPSWYNSEGKTLLNLDWSNDSDNRIIKKKLSKLFQSCIEEIIGKNTKTVYTTDNITIKFDDIKRVLKNKRY